MRKHTLVLMTTIMVLALATMAIAADPHVGTWKLNVAKSKFHGPADNSSTATFTAKDNGISLVVDGVDANGKASHSEFTAKYDGKDYPLTGDPGTDTVSLKKIDANTWSEVLKKAGKEVGTGRNAVSKDGKTMTRTTKGKDAKGQAFNNTTVYDKQ